MKLGICLALLFGCPIGVKANEIFSGGVKIAYTDQGSGSAVLLIHGLHGSGAANWTLPGITAALAENQRVIVMDVRGHGKSDKPGTSAEYGMKMAEDVIALLNQLEIRRAHLVGYSMGGLIAMKTAVLHPTRVQSLLMCGMGWLKEGGALQQFWRRTRHPCSSSFAELAVTEAQVQALTMPAAIIVGDQDPVDRLYVSPLAQTRRDWPVTHISGAGHITCIAKPEFRAAVVKAIAQFGTKSQR